MENLDLSHYILQARKSGMSDEQIRQGLIQSGWQVNDVNEAIMRAPAAVSSQPGPKAMMSKTLAVIFIVLTIAVVGYFAGAYYMANYQNFSLWPFEANDQVPTFTPRPSPVATPDPTSGWSTYREEEYGLEFKYPADWYFKTGQLDNGAPTIFLDPPTVSPNNHVDTDLPYAFRAIIYSQLTQFDWRKLKVINLDDFMIKYSVQPDPYVMNVEKVTLGSNEWYKAKAGPNVFGGGEFYFIQNGNIIFEIKVFNLGQATPGDAKIIIQILSTFKFTK